MSRLALYTVFHCNLSFSALPEEDIPLVVARCYQPLLDLAEHHGLPLGIELSASTLLRARESDPGFVERLVRLVREGKAELVGSGRIQSILPLVPVGVNRANILTGLRSYREFFGEAPRVAYLNEQVWSDGLPALYAEAGFEAVVVDWWNAAVGGGLEPAHRYRPVVVRGAGDSAITALWNDTEVFQKVQRYAHGRIGLVELVAHLESHMADEPRALSLYGADAEIFDYRPGRDLFHHPDERPAGVEMGRLAALADRLVAHPEVDLLLPSQVLDRFPVPEDEAPVPIADAAYPVRTKKQPKYNVTRWAVTGRADTAINTRCWALAEGLDELEALAAHTGRDLASELEEGRAALSELWSSDYRTHISDRRFVRFTDRVGELAGRVRRERASLQSSLRSPQGWRVVNPGSADAAGKLLRLPASFAPSERPDPCVLTCGGDPVPCQWEDVLRHADGSVARATLLARLDLPAGADCLLRPTGPSVTTLAPLGGHAAWRVDEGPARISLWGEKPGTVRSLGFPGFADGDLIGTLPHGGLPDVNLLADLFTGHALLVTEDGRQITDLDDVRTAEPEAWADVPLRRSVEFRAVTDLGEFRKRYHVYRDEPVVELEQAFNLRGVRPVAFRLGYTTFLPGAFDRESLALRTLNGGDVVERYPLAGRHVAQDSPVNVRVSARHCHGATGGWIEVLDAHKGVRISRDCSLLYSVPLVRYEEVGEGALLRVLHSVGERDETLTATWKGRHYTRFRWEGFRSDEGVRTSPPVLVIPPGPAMH